MTDRELMQQALDALDLHAKQYPHMVKGYTADAAEALRAALAQPQREWQGLTAGEIKILRRAATNDREFADLISAKLKEKNNG